MSDELKKVADDINNTFGEFRTEVETLKGKVDSLDDLKLDRMVEDMTTKMEALQTEQTKLQAAMSRNEVEGKANDYVEDKKKLDTWFRDNSERSQIEIRAMSTDSNPDGGYLVRPALSTFIASRIFETSPLRQYARVETIGTKSVEILIDDNEAGFSWVSEGQAPSATGTPQVGRIEIPVHHARVKESITLEQAQDSYLNVEAWLQAKFADRLARGFNTAYVEGDGVGKPRGFLSYTASTDADVYERNKIGQVNLGATSFGTSAASDGLVELQATLKEGYQGNAIFGMKRKTYGDVLKSKGADNYFFGTQLLKDGQLQSQLLGKPVVFMDDMPAVASAALAVVYGDFNQGYTIVDRVGFQVLKDPYTNNPDITFYGYVRSGGAVTNFDAIKLGKLSV